MESSESSAAGVAERFRVAMAGADADRIAGTLTSDVAFYSPAFADPTLGRATVAAVLATAAEVYRRMDFGEPLTAGPLAVLFFEAEVSGHALQGCYRLQTSPDGQVARLDALMRPLEATQALVAEMMRRTGA
jgi:hypothetical protein